jgi:hypothetical protein
MKNAGKGSRIDRKAKIEWREETVNLVMEGLGVKKAYRANVKER